MESRNSHVSGFIEYYCRLPVVPEYALLIKGAWGCGKSHLVNETIAELENSDESIKFLFVSLYGVTTTEDIEAKFFQLLNPILASKGMVFATTLAKGVLKGAFKVDVDGDGKNDGSMTVGVPDINISKYITDTKNCVLVFDDLERCPMPVKEILGYINYFVEKDGYKVILIAEEQELSKKNNNGITSNASNYSLIKEKLIGKTLEVEPDVSFVFDVFIEEVIDDQSVKDVLTCHKHEIISHFNDSGYNNLRSLRKSLIDFERLYLILEDEIKEKDDLILHLITIFIILSLEIHSGKITPKEIHELFGAISISGIMSASRESSEPNIFTEISKKYEGSFNDSLFNIDLWVTFFDKGDIDNNINNSIKESRYFYNDTTPTWRRLWSLYDLNDETFDKYYKDVKNKFDKFSYTNLGEVKHIGGLFLRLAHEKLLGEVNSNTIFNELKNYIDHIFIKNMVEVTDSTYEQLNDRHIGYGNLGWPESTLPNFTRFSDYLNNKIIESQKEALIHQADEVLEAMKTDFRVFNSLLTNNEYEKSRFQLKPIMQHVDIDKFMDVFLCYTGNDKNTVINILSRRYNNFYHDKLKEDFNWLKGFAERLKKESHERENTLTGFHLKNILPKIDAVVYEMRSSIEKAVD